MSNRYETRLKIAEKEVEGFQEFKKWVYQVNTTTTSVTPTKEGWHYDVEYYDKNGARHNRVELKYMPEKVYTNYDKVILNLEKALDLPGGKECHKAADLFWIQYKDYTVTISRDQINDYIKNTGIYAFIMQSQYVIEMDPTKGKKLQIQVQIPHEYEGVYYTLYNGTECVKNAKHKG